MRAILAFGRDLAGLILGAVFHSGAAAFGAGPLDLAAVGNGLGALGIGLGGGADALQASGKAAQAGQGGAIMGIGAGGIIGGEGAGAFGERRQLGLGGFGAGGLGHGGLFGDGAHFFEALEPFELIALGLHGSSSAESCAMDWGRLTTVPPSWVRKATSAGCMAMARSSWASAPER